jgi:dTDP-4-dehydrorhamnose 3,5-epimerase
MGKWKPECAALKVFGDDRGVFVPFLPSIPSDKNKQKKTIKRVYYIYNYGKGIIRGFHFHKKEWKYFSIVNGSAKFVAINPENDKEQYTFVSSSRNPNLITIPPGYANGWISLEDNTILVCASSSTFEESIKDDKRYDPFTWGDVWMVQGR